MRRYGSLTRQALTRWLPRDEPFEYLYEPIADYPLRGGKMMRSSLCIAAARAFGGSVEATIDAAVSIELMHNALLIHDDIEDGSDERRGQPTLHRKHGIPIALNVGDALSLLSIRPLTAYGTTLGPAAGRRIFEELDRMGRETAEGQALELGWRRHNHWDLGQKDYLGMILKKTCWLATIYPLRLGVLIATRDGTDLDRFVRFGFFLGAAFQIQDDLLNLQADERYGKELNGDLWEGKRTLMLIDLHGRCTDAERLRLRELLAGDRESRRACDVSWLRERIDHYGCIERARGIAHGLAGAAQHEAERLFGTLPPTEDKDFLLGLPAWVLQRS
jgi:geranylgeranyl diphosphate synthase type II